jgi:hypothetical protein
MTQCRRATAAAIVIALGASSPSLALEFTVRRIVDAADPVPGAPTAAWGDFPFFDVALDGDGLAFVGHSTRSGEFRDGVYVYRGGSLPLQLIADTDVVRPGTGELFADFWRVTMDDGVVAFTNQDAGTGLTGVYRHDGHDLQIIADDATVIPGKAPQRFAFFGDVAIHDGAVLFGGGSQPHITVAAQDGLYLSAQGVLGAVVDSSTPIPGGSGNFDLVGEVGLEAGGFAFTRPHPGSSVDDGIYRNLGSGVEVVADLSSVAPHTGTPFTNFRAMSRDAGATAFVAEAAGRTAVYLAEDHAPLRAIATIQTPYPGAGQNFAGFSNRVAASAGRVAFIGFWNPPGQFSRDGLFVTNGTELVKITEMGAQIDGRVVDGIELSQQGFDWPNLAFSVHFQDGGDALYLASFGNGCTPTSTSLCLQGSRFQVELQWQSPPDFPALRPALVSPLTTAQTGFFYFVGAENLELMVKVLDGCALNSHDWVFAAAATNVEYTLKVTDTTTSIVREYHNALGERAAAVNDTSAFLCP